jgi:hypothetical protein
MIKVSYIQNSSTIPCKAQKMVLQIPITSIEPFRGYGGSFFIFGGNIIELNIVVKGAIVINTIGTML